MGTTDNENDELSKNSHGANGARTVQNNIIISYGYFVALKAVKFELEDSQKFVVLPN